MFFSGKKVVPVAVVFDSIHSVVRHETHRVLSRTSYRWRHLSRQLRLIPMYVHVAWEQGYYSDRSHTAVHQTAY